MGALSLSWPVLCFARPDCISTIARFDTEEELCRASLEGVRELSQLEEHFVIDSRGMKVLLGNPELKTSLHGLRRVWAVVSNSLQPIVFRSVISVGPISVDELRELVFRDFDEYPDYWAETELDAFRSAVKRATTHAEIIAMF